MAEPVQKIAAVKMPRSLSRSAPAIVIMLSAALALQGCDTYPSYLGTSAGYSGASSPNPTPTNESIYCWDPDHKMAYSRQLRWQESARVCGIGRELEISKAEFDKVESGQETEPSYFLHGEVPASTPLLYCYNPAHQSTYKTFEPPCVSGDTEITAAQYAKLNKSQPIAPASTAQSAAELSVSIGQGEQANQPASPAGSNPSTANDPALITVVQQALNILGYDVGPADGAFGARTQIAIRKYEKSVGMPEDGQVTPQLAVSLQTALAIEQRQAAASQAAPNAASASATGSGFYISNAALVLTNYHVVKGCRSVSVGGATASVVSFDSQNDLAVLQTAHRSGNVVTLRDRPPVRAGERIVAVGYPLTGLLAEQANVTSGDVSSLAGINNDSRYLQITAPVQPGNSGGPLFDSSGNLVGVVSGKLDAIKMAGLTGDIPENVNFALNVSVVRGFLEAHGIGYQTAISNSDRLAPDIGDWGKSVTRLVECFQ